MAARRASMPMIEAGHPVPDAAGLESAARRSSCARRDRGRSRAGADVGRRSANWIAPAGITFAEKQAVTRALLRSGAHIGEINTVRKHLSAIKGGRLARATYPARVVTLAISDVPGDDPAVIGSGPTVPDPSTLADARAIVAKFKLDLPEAVTRALNDPANESPKPGDPAFANADYRLIARPADSFRAAEAAVRAAGYECVFLGANLEGEARKIAAAHAGIAQKLQAAGRRAVVLSGGELTVTIRGKGRGGPNQEYALALAIGLPGPAASRRSPPTPTAPTAAPARPRTRPAPRRRRHGHAGAGTRPRSGRVSCRQRLHGFLRARGRSAASRAHLHQRQ
jgi:hydroxypyruvate reductase